MSLMSSTVALLCCLAGLAHTAHGAQRVAVIGGGVAGASAAYYTRKALGADAVIEAFDREQLGGRAQELEYDGVTLELGASIIWEKNWLIRELAAAAGLERAKTSDGLIAVYDGRELIFRQSSWRLLTLLRLIFRYWFSWLNFQSAPAAMWEKFQTIYTLLDNGKTFDTPEMLLKQIGLYDLTQVSMYEWLRESYGASIDALAKELIGGVNLVNYGQTNEELNALAGHVSMLPATEPSVFRIKGGNSQLAPCVFAVANATVRTPVAVTSVERLPDGFWLEVQEQCTAAPGRAMVRECAATYQGPYGAVIIATPLESSGLAFPGRATLPAIPARKFVQTVVTIILGAVRPSYFGVSQMDYGVVMVTEDAQVPWSSLSLVGRTASNQTLWKMFSREPLPHAWQEILFEKGFLVVVEKIWSSPGAYPIFDPPEDFAPFTLGDGLFYAAALENAASALEMAAIEGRMTALLAAKHLSAAAEKQRSQQEVEAGLERQGGSSQHVLAQQGRGAKQQGTAAAA